MWGGGVADFDVQNEILQWWVKRASFTINGAPSRGKGRWWCAAWLPLQTQALSKSAASELWAAGEWAALQLSGSARPPVMLSAAILVAQEQGLGSEYFHWQTTRSLLLCHLINSHVDSSDNYQKLIWGSEPSVQALWRSLVLLFTSDPRLALGVFSGMPLKTSDKGSLGKLWDTQASSFWSDFLKAPEPQEDFAPPSHRQEQSSPL